MKFKRNHKISRIILVLSLVMIFLINFNFQHIIYTIFKYVLIYSFILFLSGYSFVILFYKKEKPTTSEIFILSIGMSISLTILCGIFIHVLGMRISSTAILNLVSLLTIIFSLPNTLKTFLSLKTEKEGEFSKVGI